MIDKYFGKCIAKGTCSEAKFTMLIYHAEEHVHTALLEKRYEVFIARDSDGQLNIFTEMPLRSPEGCYRFEKILESEGHKALYSKVEKAHSIVVNVRIMVQDMVGLDNAVCMPNVQLG